MPPLFREINQVVGQFFIKNYMYKTNKLEIILNRVINYTAEMSFNHESVRTVLTNVGASIEGIADESLNVINHVTERQLKFWNSLFGSLLRGPAQILINILVLIIILLVICGAVYFYCTSGYCCRRCCHQCGSIKYINSPLSALITKRRRYTTNNNIEFGIPSNSLSPQIEIFVNEKFAVSALVDTGAVFSLIDADLFRKIPNLKLHETDVKPVAANGEIIKILGAVFINIKIADVDETILAYVQENSSFKVILGVNFLNRFKTVSFSWINSTIRFRSAEIPCPSLVYNFPLSRGCIALIDDLSLQPMSITCIFLPVSKLYSLTDLVLFEPEVTASKSVYAAAAVCPVIDGHIPVQFLNIGSSTELMRHKTPVGSIKAFNNDCQVENPTPIWENKISELIRSKIELPNHLSSSEKQKLLAILFKFPTLYAFDEKDTGKTNLVSHEIKTGTSFPIRRFPFRTSPKEKEIITKEIEQMKKRNYSKKHVSMVNKRSFSKKTKW